MKRTALSAQLTAMTLFVAACGGVDQTNQEDQNADGLRMNVPGGSLDYTNEVYSGLPGCYRCSAATGDFDGDGKVDLVMAGAFDSAVRAGTSTLIDNNEIRIYRNNSRIGSSIRFVLQATIAGAHGA